MLLQRSFRNSGRAPAEAGRIGADLLLLFQLKLLLVLGQGRRERDGPLGGGGHVASGSPDLTVCIVASVARIYRHSEIIMNFFLSN